MYHFQTIIRPVNYSFILSTNSQGFAVISTHARRNPLRIALRTDFTLHQAAQENGSFKYRLAPSLAHEVTTTFCSFQSPSYLPIDRPLTALSRSLKFLGWSCFFSFKECGSYRNYTFYFTISYFQSIMPPNSLTLVYPSFTSSSAAILLLLPLRQ